MLASRRRLFSLLLVTLLLISILAQGVKAANTADIKGHWAEATILKWVDLGLIGGFADGFHPDAMVTRAEFTGFINRAFGYRETVPISFSDVRATDWFARDVAKAIAAGYVAGFADGTFRPGAPVTFIDAAAMLYQALKLETVEQVGEALAPDVNEGVLAPHWEMLNVLNAVQMLEPSSACLSPELPLTRAEAVDLLDRAAGAVYNQAGTYGPEEGVLAITGNATVSVSGVTLRNLTISGDLYISEGVGDGQVTLQNVTVLGRTIVAGGGPNCVYVAGQSHLVRMTVIDPNGDVRVIFLDTSVAEGVDFYSGGAIQNNTSGGLDVFLRDLPPGSTVVIEGEVDNLTISSPDVTVIMAPGSHAKNVAVLPTAAGATIAGEGTIDVARVDAEDVLITAPTTEYVVGDSDTSIGGQPITEPTGLPVITLRGAANSSVTQNASFVDPGATAVSPAGNDLTDQIVVSGQVNTKVVGIYTLTYNVTDLAGRAATPVIRTVRVTAPASVSYDPPADTTKPVITLVGANPLLVEAGTVFADPGASAQDNRDGNVTSLIVRGGQVNALVVGDYSLTYDVTDASGNAAVTVTRTVRVQDTTVPALSIPADQTVEATAELTPVAIGQATATDLFPVVVTSDAPAAYPLGVTDVTWTATDANNNHVSGMQKITVVDTALPTVDLIAPPSGLVRGNVTLTITATDATLRSVELQINRQAPVYAAWMSILLYADAQNPLGTPSLADQQLLTAIGATASYAAGPGNSGTWTFSFNSDANHPNNDQVFPYGDYLCSVRGHDAAGNTKQWAFAPSVTYTIDNVAPVLTLLGSNPQTLEVHTAYVDAGATALDNHDGNLTGNVVIDSTALNIDLLGQYPVSYSVTDAAGNTAACTRTVNVVDTTAPVITLIGAADLTIEAGSNYVDAGATALDNYDGNLTQSIVVTGLNLVDPQTVGDYTVSYNVSDAQGIAAATVTRTVRVRDTVAPQFTSVPGGITTEATADPLTPVNIGLATATDLFAVTVTNDAPAGGFPLGTTVVTWTATDPTGNFATAVQPVTVLDTTAPAFSFVPGGITLEATAAPTTPVNIGQATATDIFGIASLTSNSPGSFPVGTTVVTWTAVDPNGRTATATQSITVTDTTDPVLQLPADVVAQANAIGSIVDIGLATATDIFPVLVQSNAPATYPLGVTQVTWTATDQNGNVVSGVQTVTVVDNIQPVVNLVTPPTSAVRGQVVMTITATDATLTRAEIEISRQAPVFAEWMTINLYADALNPWGNPPLDEQETLLALGAVANYTAGPGSLGTWTLAFNSAAEHPVGVLIFPDGDYLFAVRANDQAGNTRQWAVSPKVTYSIDNTLPVLALNGVNPQTIVVHSPYVEAGATASDNIDGNLTGSIVIDASAVDIAHLGSYGVTYTVADASGNGVTLTRTVDVIDNVIPVITLKGNDNPLVEAGSVYTDKGATASDNYDGNLTAAIQVNGLAAVNTSVIGNYFITYDVVDSSGNAAVTVTRKVRVRDNTDPVFSFVPGDLAAEATGNPLTLVNIGQATATDFFPVVVTNDAPAAFPLGITAVTWTATDQNGHSVSAVQQVTVQDTTAPAFTFVPANITSEATANPTTPVDVGLATASDLFGIASLASDSPGSFPVGVTTVTWTAIDGNGNLTTATQTVTVADTIAPVFTFVPGDITIDATGWRTPVATGLATASDLFAPVVTSDQPADFPLGTTTVTWTATDGNGNQTTATQNVTVRDITPPLITSVTPGSRPLHGVITMNIQASDATLSGAEVRISQLLTDWLTIDLYADELNPLGTPDPGQQLALNDIAAAATYSAATQTWTLSFNTDAVRTGGGDFFPDGDYTVHVRARDVMPGNTLPWPLAAVVTYTIDNTVPTAQVNYSNPLPTNLPVLATLFNNSEPITVTNNGGIWSYSFVTNASFTFVFEDAAGNVGTVDAVVTNIDDIAPTAEVRYDITTPTTGPVVATLWSESEPITITNNGGLADISFLGNGSFIFQFVDAVGNPGSATATVTWIDLVAPTGTISYSTLAPTNQPVTATLVPSEPVTVTNNLGLDYTFAANGSFTFQFVDAAGNPGTATATVSNIDLTAPTVNSLNQNNATTLRVIFSEPMDAATALDTANYAVYYGGVLIGNPTAAVFGATDDRVRLTVPDMSGLPSGANVTVVVTGVTDPAGNLVVAPAQVTWVKP